MEERRFADTSSCIIGPLHNDRHLQGGGNRFDDLAGEYQGMTSPRNTGSGHVVAAAGDGNHGKFCLCG